MSTMTNVGILLGGYCAISAVTAASVWAINQGIKSPGKGSIRLPARPNIKTTVGRLKIKNTIYSAV